MPPWQQEVLLVLISIGLQIGETRVRIGKAQSKIAWVIGIVSVVLVVLAGVLAAAGWLGGIASWIAGLGSGAVLVLGTAGVVLTFMAVLTLLPQGIAADTTSTMTLVAAFLVPALWPYVVQLFVSLGSILPAAVGALPGSFGA